MHNSNGNKASQMQSKLLRDNVADDATNPYPLAMKPSDIKPNERGIHLSKLSIV